MAVELGTIWMKVGIAMDGVIEAIGVIVKRLREFDDGRQDD